MYLPTVMIMIFTSSLAILQLVAGMAVPEYRLRTLTNSALLGNDSKDPNSTISINFRRDSPTGIRSSFGGPTGSPISLGRQEVRCGPHIYQTEYIQRTLDTVTSLRFANKTLGDSGFPQPYGDEGHVMIFPMLRTDEIFDGSEDKPIGPDRIAVGMMGRTRYTIFTMENQNSPDALNLQTCESLAPRNASIAIR